MFGAPGRPLLEYPLHELPSETQRSVREELALLDQLERQITGIEDHILEIVAQTP
jgi:hypothetical protein